MQLLSDLTPAQLEAANSYLVEADNKFLGTLIALNLVSRIPGKRYDISTGIPQIGEKFSTLKKITQDLPREVNTS
ncbi:hypothetical protein JI667_17000 [Bacillus sp. NTK074B]|nr:hypothetical protein [Bacillus sp. NTK074B]